MRLVRSPDLVQLAHSSYFFECETKPDGRKHRRRSERYDEHRSNEEVGCEHRASFAAGRGENVCIRRGMSMS